jgi:hypothetical protein
MHNGEYREAYKGSNISILSDSQAAIKVLNNVQINSQLVWDCQQSLVRLENITGFNRYVDQDI